MFFHADIKGADLPPRTLCLTYDDGPGPQTADLGQYLHQEGIQATFFVIGRHAEQHPDSLAQLVTQGHIIGNHTFSHPGLVSLAESGGELIEEIALTEAVIRPYTGGGITFFRPPYGNWRQEVESGRDSEHSIVAEQLNACGLLKHYLGPVNWDISGEDYDYWRAGAPAADVAERYLKEIEQAGHGMVLMHDSSDEEVIRNRNRTCELTRLLVTQLKRRGYHFVPLTELPQVRAAVAVAWEQLAERAPAHRTRAQRGAPATGSALSHSTHALKARSL